MASPASRFSISSSSSATASLETDDTVGLLEKGIDVGTATFRNTKGKPRKWRDWCYLGAAGLSIFLNILFLVYLGRGSSVPVNQPPTGAANFLSEVVKAPQPKRLNQPFEHIYEEGNLMKLHSSDEGDAAWQKYVAEGM